MSTLGLSCATLSRFHHGCFAFSANIVSSWLKKSSASGNPRTDTFLRDGRASVAMLNVEKVLKDLNLSLARFGDSDVVTTRPLLSQQIDGSEVRRLHREIAARLGFKTE